jgi:uncharacterized protein YecT (DUF1311 family)
MQLFDHYSLSDIEQWLNDEYKLLMKATPRRVRPRLIEAERAWIRFRDTETRALGKEWRRNETYRRQQDIRKFRYTLSTPQSKEYDFDHIDINRFSLSYGRPPKDREKDRELNILWARIKPIPTSLLASQRLWIRFKSLDYRFAQTLYPYMKVKKYDTRALYREYNRISHLRSSFMEQ